ncbi:MAG: hypothetical protein EOP04_04900 [Proteobacteria bacterium]|nr:MAG: hypothetical protein EOP04_04900 [Pseudomonadota bacterium]
MTTGTLSTQIWGINWTKEFPTLLGSGIRIEYKRFAECKADAIKIMAQGYKLNEQPPMFADKTSSTFKDKFYDHMGDFFIFIDPATNAKIGVAVCVLKDHASIDFRTIVLLDEYQNKGIYPEFMELLATILKRHGVSRIEGDLSPTNGKHHQVLAKMGFCFTGMSSSSGHGLLNHVVRYLDDDDKAVYTDLFSATRASDKSANTQFHRKAG